MMQPRPPTGTAGLATELIRTANHLRTHLERTVLRRAGLTWTTFDVLQTVCAAGRIHTTSTMLTVGVAKGTLSAAVDTLVGQGLLQRYPHPGDRRLIDLIPTSDARRLTAHIQETIAREETWLAHHGHLDATALAAQIRAIVTPLRPRERTRAPTQPQPPAGTGEAPRDAQERTCVTR